MHEERELKSRQHFAQGSEGRPQELALLLRLSLYALACIPLVVLIFKVCRYAVDIPFWDQWNFVPILGKAYDGSLRLVDFWQQHNEHRLFFPRILMVALARWSKYSIFYELGANLLLATTTLILVSFSFLKAVRHLCPGKFPWVVPVFSLLVYALHQGENWLWGWQLQIFLNVLAVVAGCLLLTAAGQKRSLGLLGGAMVAGVVAAYSFANGLLFWVIGLAAIVMLPFGSRQKKRLLQVAWVVVMAVTFFSYFYRFQFASPSGKAWNYFLSHPDEYLRYVCQFLGASIINYEEYAFIFGLVGAIFFLGMSVWLGMRKKEVFRDFFPFFLFGLYAIGCAALTGIGRLGFGTVQAMSYRYVTFSLLLWIANFVYLFLLVQLFRRKERRRAIRLISQAAIIASVFLLLFGIVRTSYRVGHRVFISHHHRLVPVWQELQRNPNPSDDLLLRLYIDADYVRNGISLLRKHGLSVFRSARPGFDHNP